MRRQQLLPVVRAQQQQVEHLYDAHKIHSNVAQQSAAQPPLPRNVPRRHEQAHAQRSASTTQQQQQHQTHVHKPHPDWPQNGTQVGKAAAVGTHAAHTRAPAQHKTAWQRQPSDVQAVAVAQWLSTAAQVHSRTHPKDLCNAMRCLASVRPAEAETQRQQVASAISRLIAAHFAGGYRHATFIDAIGTGLAEQQGVRSTCFTDGSCAERISKLLQAAADADETYTNLRCTAQVATAQRKLGMYCAAFWQRLEERGVGGIAPRQLATLVYCAGVLVNDGVGPGPSAALWDDMQQAVEDEVHSMNGQELANVILAHAYMDTQPVAGVHRALFSAMQCKQPHLAPQAAANVVWAAGKLGLQLSNPQQQLLFQLLQQHAGCMNAQGVSNAWMGLAHLKLQPSAVLSAALQGVVVATAKDMNSQGVANTLWAFVKLGVSLQPDVAAALLQRARGVSSDLNEQGVANTLYAIAKLRLQAGEALRDALLHQVQHVADRMTEQNVANTMWALAEAKLAPGPSLSKTLLEQVERVSGGLVAEGVVQVLDGAARLGLQSNESQRRAIMAAHRRTQPSMDADGKAMTERAIKQLGWSRSNAPLETTPKRPSSTIYVPLAGSAGLQTLATSIH